MDYTTSVSQCFVINSLFCLLSWGDLSARLGRAKSGRSNSGIFSASRNLQGERLDSPPWAIRSPAPVGGTGPWLGECPLAFWTPLAGDTPGAPSATRRRTRRGDTPSREPPPRPPGRRRQGRRHPLQLTPYSEEATHQYERHRTHRTHLSPTWALLGPKWSPSSPKGLHSAGDLTKISRRNLRSTTHG